MTARRASRIENIPPYLFAEVDRKKAQLRARGVDLIDLGVGDPDLPTPSNVVERLSQAARKPEYHRYPDYQGSLEFRRSAAKWFRGRFGVDLDPGREIMALIGSKEGIAHIFWAYVDPGDYTLVTDPGYPVYKTHTILAGGTPYYMPLRPENGYLPDLDAVPTDVAAKATLMFLNYPNNPTAGVADLAFFERAVAFARKYDIVVCHDAAYSEITFDGYVAPSILEIPGARDVAVEFHSLSKPFNMTGWRIGFAVGGSDHIAALGIIKTNTDSGQFTAIQEAAIEALLKSADFTEEMRQIYRRRRDLVVDGLQAAGLQAARPLGSFYIWAPVPEGRTSAEFVTMLMEEAGIIVIPGSAYGEAGEGYFRISLTVPDDRLEEAVQRITRKVRF